MNRAQVSRQRAQKRIHQVEKARHPSYMGYCPLVRWGLSEFSCIWAWSEGPRFGVAGREGELDVPEITYEKLRNTVARAVGAQDG